MAQSIVSVTINGTPDKMLQLANAEAVRKMYIGNNWNRLCVAALLHLPYSSMVQLDAMGIALGICTSQGDSYYGASPKHIYGVRHWVNLTPSVGAELISGSSNELIRYLNGALTTWGIGNPFGIGRANRTGFAIQFRRVGTNIYTRVCMKNGTAGGYLTESQFFAGLEALTMDGLRAVWGGSSYYSLFSEGDRGVLDESTYGPLDSIWIAWPLVTQKLHVAAIGYAKWA